MLDLILGLGFQLKYLREPTYDPNLTYWQRFEEKAPNAWNPQKTDVISAMEIFCRSPW
jgi:hypothetical protein